MKLMINAKQKRKLHFLMQKYNVSWDVIKKNWENIQRFIQHATTVHIVIKCAAIRRRKNRIVLNYWLFSRCLWDPKCKKIMKLRRENIEKWSKQMVIHLKLTNGPIVEFSEDVYEKSNNSNSSQMLPPEEVSKQMKVQLELLKDRKRTVPLINGKLESRNFPLSPSKTFNKVKEKKSNTGAAEKIEKSVSQKDHTVKEDGNTSTKNLKSSEQSGNFLDMLMSKVKTNKVADIKLPRAQQSQPVVGKNTNKKQNSSHTEPPTLESETTTAQNLEIENSTDSSDEFLGFEDGERHSGLNSAFVSESLNTYMRENDLEGLGKDNTDMKSRKRILDGVVTLGCVPPKLEMPIIPENLQKLRTVAERRQFLQKTKNHKYSIIYSGATVYRELQKKIRQQKINRNSIHLLYSSHMPFTRKSWSAASFLLTDINRFYFQEIFIDNSKVPIKLYGSFGNNENLVKRPHTTRVPYSLLSVHCSPNCIDLINFRQFKPINTHVNKVKLNSISMKPFYKPCPLSRKPKALQTPIEQDDLPILKNDDLTVVRIPQVELEVFPQLEKPLPDVAKRYLELILPYGEISREWAEFSVSTLVDSARKRKNNASKESFTFTIPFINDRNHILVRKVFDRSEKLDESFESPDRMIDLTFREKINLNDSISFECGEVLNDMINSVAISCSENTFIKDDPTDVYTDGSLFGGATILSNGKKGAVVPKAQNKKQNRLLSELRRLNATVIDAGARTNKSFGVCKNDFCRLGCICSSLKNNPTLRQHCGKAKCMLSCSCKIVAPQSYLQLETDGRTLTTEDAFLLRRQATASLARIEKEFTSTIVLTENETLLINESQIDKKRRCTKIPKRYDDFIDSDESPNKSSPPGRRPGLSPTETNEDWRPNSSTAVSDIMANSCEMLQEPIFVKDHIIESMKHCTVDLVRLDDIDNLTIWCMVHQLYNCFCGGKALEGKMITIETEGENITISSSSSSSSSSKKGHGKAKQDVDEYMVKASYSFEKEESSRPVRKNNHCPIVEKEPWNNDVEEVNSDIHIDDMESNDDDSFDESDTTSIDDFTADPDVNFNRYKKKANLSGKPEKRGRIKDELIFFDYLTALADQCRRVVPIPSKLFRRRNRKRVLLDREYIENNENANTQILLNEHIMRSVYFHPEVAEKRKKRSLDKSETLQNKAKREKKEFVEKIENDSKSREKVETASKQIEEKSAQKIEAKPQNEIVKNNDDLELKTQILQQTDNATECCETAINENENKNENENENEPNHASDSDDSNSQKEQRKRQNLTPVQNDVISPPDAKKAKTANADENKNASEIAGSSSAETPTKQTQPTDETSFPKIASYCSLSNADEYMNLDTATPTSSTSVQNTNDNTESNVVSDNPNSLNIDGELLAFTEIYDTVIKNMNNLVSKKMQDIDMALKRESKFVPRPNEEILCIIKWSNFLDAFVEGFVFIWEIKMQRKEHNFLAATTTNLMPMVVNAVGVVIITAVDRHKLPLLAQMLIDRCCSPNTNKLAIVMQGRRHYWVVKGFLRQDTRRACAKPTPTTHPLLTKKINVLCSLLVKQHVKDDQRNADLSAKGVSEQSTSSLSQSTSQPLLQPPSKQATKQQPTSVKAQMTRAPENATNILTKSATIMKELIGRGYANIQSNIKFRKVTKSDIEEIHCPERIARDHRWLVIDLHKDFSHIFVPDFQDLVSLDRIHRVMAFSRQKKKIVKLQFFQDAPFDAYVTPTSRRKLYFGPLQFNMRPPLLLLLQSVDGLMMLREVYQHEHNITPTDEQTTAFWVLQVKGRLNFAMESGETAILSHHNNISEDDDDCMIVEDESESTKQTSRPEDTAKDINSQSCASNSVACTITSDPNSGSILASTSALSKSINSIVSQNPSDGIREKECESIESLESPAILQKKFTLSSLDYNSSLGETASASHAVVTPTIQPRAVQSMAMQQIPTESSTLTQSKSNQIHSSLELPQVVTTQTGQFIPLLNLPVIASVTAPKDAPYGSTIFISNVQSSPIEYKTVNSSNTSVFGTATTINRIRAGSITTTTSAVSLITTPMTTTASKPIIKTADLSNFTIISGSQTQSRQNTFKRMSPPPVPFARPAIKSGPIQRRRISVMCTPSEYRQMSNGKNSPLAKKPLRPLLPISKIVLPTHLNTRPKPSVAAPIISSPTVTTNKILIGKSITTGNPVMTTLKITSPATLVKSITITTTTTNTTTTTCCSTAPTATITGNKLSNNKQHAIQSIGSTTITKVIDNLDRLSFRGQGENHNIHSTMDSATLSKVAKLTAFVSNATKPLTSEPVEESKTTPKEPLVIDVNFIDNSDEPSASIVIKPITQISPSSVSNMPIAKAKPRQSGVITIPISTTAKTIFSNNISVRPQMATSLLKPTTNVGTSNNKATVMRTYPSSFTAPISVANNIQNVMKKNQTFITSSPSKSNRSFQRINIVSPASLSNEKIVEKSTQEIDLPLKKVISDNVVTLPQSSIMKIPKAPNIADPLDILNKISSSETSQQDTVVITTPKSMKILSSTGTTGTVTVCRSLNAKIVSDSTISTNTLTKSLNPIKSPVKPKLPIQMPKVQLLYSKLKTANENGNSTKSLPEVLPFQYGYFTGNLVGLPKFLVKRVKEDYLIKLPGLQNILRLKGLTMVNSYLNQHVKKYYNNIVPPERLPITWKFVAQDRRHVIQTKKVGQSKINTSKVSNVSSSTVSQSTAIKKIINNDPILIED